MDYLSFFTLGFIGLATLVYLLAKWRYTYWSRKGVTQLEPEFFYGNVRSMVKGEKSIAVTFLEMYEQFKSLGVKYGGIYSLFNYAFVPIDPELIKDIMQKNFEHFTAHFPTFKDPTIMQKGLFHLREEPWRQTRKKLTPTFTSGKMKMMFETMLEKTTGLSEVVKESVESGEPAHIKVVLGRFTTDVIGSVGFGIEIDALKNPDSDFVKYGRLIFDPPEKKTSIWQLIVRVITRSRRRIDKDIRPAENFFKKIVSDTIDYREKNKLFRKDFMHLMIQLKNRGVITDDEQVFTKSDNLDAANTFDIDEITAQTLIFFLAGYETSATTMTFALLELAQHQDMQEKVRQEVNEVLKKHNGKMTYDAVMDLKYAEKVIQETLRRYPPVATIPRVCTKDYKIPGTDIVIPRDTSTFIPCWGIHMDPEYWPEPEKFDPQRFNEDNKQNIKDFTYMPFGEGPRMCLGLRFGMMQSKVGLASLVRNYNFTLHEKTTFPLKIQRDAFITAVDGDVWLNVKKVN